MRFIRYNPDDGKIVAYGGMEEQYIQAEINAGLPTLFSDNVTDFDTWKVNLETKELERVNPQEPLPEVPPDVLALFNTLNGATSS